MHKIKRVFQYGGREYRLATGELARQASRSVTVECENVFILGTLVQKKSDSNLGYLPLTVQYLEKFYAGGRFPGGFMRREGRPSDNEVLIARLLDRALRGSIKKGVSDELQIVITVFSFDDKFPCDIPAMIAAFSLLAMTHLPIKDVLAPARVSYDEKREEFLLNPDYESIEGSGLDLVLAASSKGVVMIESEIKSYHEDLVYKAIEFGQGKAAEIGAEIADFAAEVRSTDEVKDAASSLSHETSESLVKEIHSFCHSDVFAACQKGSRREYKQSIADLKEKAKTHFAASFTDREELLSSLIEDAVRAHMREFVLGRSIRIDGRSPDQIRKITGKVGSFKTPHGSAIFTRGDDSDASTQAIVITTLGSKSDSQLLDSLPYKPGTRDTFLLHYNFPPYCVGEVGQFFGPKRREIGHGKLAWRGLSAVMPDSSKFPYTVRVVSEITESNGSSSMATVCGSSMSLMDAGVPIKESVAGIAIGLIKEGDKSVILSDITGEEDHLGDMDFKVVGTKGGITAVQMDLKTDPISSSMLKNVLSRAREGLDHILGEMAKVIDEPRSEFAPNVPRMGQIKIDPKQIREVIGKGGAIIKSLTEEFGVSIDVSETGEVSILAREKESLDGVIARIKELVAQPQVGEIYRGKVMKIIPAGAFIEILPGKDGFLHISQISDERVDRVESVLAEGDLVTVKLTKIDEKGRFRLSMSQRVLNSRR